MNDGLKIETAAGVIARDTIRHHMDRFAYTIRTSKGAGQDVAAAYIDALAGTLAMIIAGGHGSKEEIINASVATLRGSIERDLRHLKGR